MALVHLAEADAAKTTRLRRGDTVELRLAESPTTGYRWQVRPSAGLATITDEHIPADARPGAGGERRVALDVTEAGTHELRVELARPWEREPDRALTFLIEAE
jgi:inhibitor of cysteine peptidase